MTDTRGKLLSTLKSLLPLLVGGVGGYVIARLLLSVVTVDLDLTLPSVLLLLFALWMVFLTHEVGHLVGGYLAGFRALMLVAGPLRIYREGPHTRLGFNRHLSLWGGLALSMPDDTEDLRRRTMLYVGGGPLVSVVAGIAALLAAAALGSGAEGETAYVSVLALFGLASLAIGFVTLIPGSTSGFATDGARLLALLRGGVEAERETAAMGLITASQAGIRPRQWNPEWLETLLGVPADTLQGVLGRQLAFTHALDHGRIEEAGAYLEQTLAHLDVVPKPVRPDLLLDAAYFVARHFTDPSRARALLDDVEGGMWMSAYKRPLAEAAIALAEGEISAIPGLVEQARTKLPAALDRGQAIAASDYLDQLARTAERPAVDTDGDSERAAT